MNKETVKVSIIIPTFNFGHLIKDALQSVKSQQFTDWECIIADDGSVDNTKEVILALINGDNRFTYIYQHNKGPASARNKGLIIAKGDFIQLLDADDILEPGKLKYQIEIFNKFPSAEIVYSTAKILDLTDPDKVNPVPILENADYRPKLSGYGPSMVKAFFKNSIYPSTALVKRSVFTELGFLDEDLMQAEDWDFFLRAAFHNKQFQFMNCDDGCHAIIRKHTQNNSADFWRLQYFVIRMRKKFNKLCKNEELNSLNRFFLFTNREDLVLESLKIIGINRWNGILHFFRTAYYFPIPRYIIYAILSIILNYSLMKKLTNFSLRNILSHSTHKNN